MRSEAAGLSSEAAWDAVVIGAGPAGLGSAAMLRKRGLTVLVLERGSAPAWSWRSRYQSLHLNSLGWLSSLPGLRGGWDWRRYPSRDEWVAYLQRYAFHHELTIRFETTARRLDRESEGWQIETSEGNLRAGRVVVATGLDKVPFVPSWPGRESFPGSLIHAAEYRTAEPFRGKDVLVVGANTTGVELAAEIRAGGAKRVRVAVRTPPNLLARYWYGFPMHAFSLILNALPTPLADRMGRAGQRRAFGDLTPYGLQPAPAGIKTNVLRRGIGPAIDCGFVRAVKEGAIEVIPAVEGFDGARVRLGGGGMIEPEIVLAATGYRRGLEELIGHLGVLDAEGRPRIHADGELPGAPGLHFVGYRSNVSGPLHQIRSDARRLAKAA